MNDFRYAVRTLLRLPMFALVVIATLTLGIGATAAIFHTVDRAVLHPLPYPHADRIVYLGMKRLRGTGTWSLTASRFQIWHDNSRIFERLATTRGFEAEVDHTAGGSVVQVARVTAEFLDILGARPEVGRPFVSDDYLPSAAPVALVTDAAWRSRFGGDANLVGSTIALDDKRVTVIGILAPSFEWAGVPTQPDVLTPLVFTTAMLGDGGANYDVIGRLRPGVSPRQIEDDNAFVFARYRALYPEYVDGNDAGVSVSSFQHVFVGDLTSALWILLAATGFVFLLACANVGNIVLARTIGRQREFAVRAALGSGRARIVRQIVAEMLVLGVASAVCAALGSLIAVRGLVGLAHDALLRDSQLSLDWRVVLFTVLAATAATLVIGVAAALFAARMSVPSSLAASARSAGLGGSGRRFRGALVTLESALAMVLLAGAGLLITSFARVLEVDGGFRRDGIYTATIAHTPRTYRTLADVWRFDQRVLERLRATPGILSAASTATLPLRRGWNIPTTVLGENDRTESATEWRAISPGYFRTMEIPVVTGRAFTDADVDGAPRVAVVSQSYAETFFPGENAIGRRILVGVYKGQGPASEASEIVGIVPDLRDASLEQTRLRHTVWLPQSQASQMGVDLPAFVVRANDPSIAARAWRAAMTGADPRIGVPDVVAMSDIVTESLSWRRFTMVLMATFAAVALVLTCVGIYGVASYAVSQRTQEIGVRMALGAKPSAVVALIVRQGARPAIIGLVIGLVLAAWGSRAIASMLFGVGPRDPVSLASVALLLGVVAVAASWLPARRAARVDPVTALRAD
jgi:predicted permease